MYNNINDYELLYLIGEKNENALNLMITKYQAVINNQIKVLSIPFVFNEEFLQEGFMVIFKAIFDFKEEYGKTFYGYFLMCLKHRFYRLIKELDLFSYSYIEAPEELGSIMSESVVHYNSFKFKNDLEKLIYEEIFLSKCSPRFFAKKYNTNIKQVYNLIYKIKNMLKELGSK